MGITEASRGPEVLLILGLSRVSCWPSPLRCGGRSRPSSVAHGLILTLITGSFHFSQLCSVWNLLLKVLEGLCVAGQCVACDWRPELGGGGPRAAPSVVVLKRRGEGLHLWGCRCLWSPRLAPFAGGAPPGGGAARVGAVLRTPLLLCSQCSSRQPQLPAVPGWGWGGDIAGSFTACRGSRFQPEVGGGSFALNCEVCVLGFLCEAPLRPSTRAVALGGLAVGRRRTWPTSQCCPPGSWWGRCRWCSQLPVSRVA